MSKKISGKTARLAAVLVLIVAAAGCWDGEQFLRGRQGPKPYRAYDLWSFSMTRHAGIPMLESDASMVPGMDVLCVFGFMGCLLLDAVVFPFALIHDVWLLLSGKWRDPPWKRSDDTYDEEWSRPGYLYGP